MSETRRVYRFRARNAADTTDLLRVTSFREGYFPPNLRPGAHPYIAAVPKIDGATHDALTGKTSVGSSQISVIDAEVTLPVVAGIDTFEEYIRGDFVGGEDGAPTALIRPGRWSRHGLIEQTGLVGPAFDPVDGVQAYVADGSVGTGSAYIERSDWGLPPDTDVVVRVRTRPVHYLGYSAEKAPDYPKIGLEVAGATGTGRDADIGPFPSEWVTRRVVSRTHPDGSLPVRLGHFDFFDVGVTRDMQWDRVEILIGGESAERIVTRSLFGPDAQAQILSRRGYLEVADEADCVYDAAGSGGVAGRWYFPDEIPVALGGPNPAAVRVLHAGYVNDVELPRGRALTFTFTVGDSQRDEERTTVFAEPTAAFPNASCVLGGPVRFAWPSAAAPIATNRGPWRFEVTVVAGDLVRLKINTVQQPVGLDPSFSRTQRWTHDNDALRRSHAVAKTNEIARAYFVPIEPGHPLYATVSALKIRGHFPRLAAEVADDGGAVLGTATPLAIPFQFSFSDLLAAAGDPNQLTSRLVAKGVNGAWLHWPAADRPAGLDVGDFVKLTVYPLDVTERAPLHAAGHVLDLTVALLAEFGDQVDAASVAAVKAQMPWLRGAWRLAPMTKKAWLHDLLGGACGIGHRRDAAGRYVFFSTRVRAAAPAGTIRLEHLRGGRAGKPPEGAVFKLEESSAIAGVTYELQRFTTWTPEDGERPIDAIVARPHKILGDRAEDPAAAYGTKEQTYQLPATIIDAVGREVDQQAFADGMSQPLIRRRGRGALKTELPVFESADYPLGAEVIVEVPHKPGADAARLPIAGRGFPAAMQVMRNTPTSTGATLLLEEVGDVSATGPEDAAEPPDDPLPVPALDLAASSSAPTTVATVTVTNAEDLATLDLDVRVEYAVQVLAPTGSGTVLGAIDTDADPATRDLPPTPPGSTLWARAVAIDEEDSPVGAYSAWVSVVLGTVQNGGGPGESPYAPTLSVTAIVDPATGTLTATATASASAVAVKFAVGAAGGAPPSLAAVRAAAAIASPFTTGTLATLANGETRTVGALAYDAVGNESALATALGTRGGAAPGTGGTGSRQTIVAVLPSAASGADAVGAVAMPAGCVVVRAAASVSCRVRAYRSAALRDAAGEIARPFGTPPSGADALSGPVLADWQLDARNARAVRCTPAVVAPTTNDSGAATRTLYLRATNQMAAAATPVVTLTVIPVEA